MKSYFNRELEIEYFLVAVILLCWKLSLTADVMHSPARGAQVPRLRHHTGTCDFPFQADTGKETSFPFADLRKQPMRQRFIVPRLFKREINVFLTLLATLCLVSSCQDERDLLAPNRDNHQLIANTVVVGDSNCTKLQFTITSATTATATWPNRATCGSGLTVIKGNTPVWSQANGRKLSLRIRILNRDAVPVQLPIRLFLPANGTTVIAPAGTPASKVIALNADSTPGTGGKVWLIGVSGTLAVGDSTVLDTIQFNVQSPVTQARFSFVVSATAVPSNPVPATPPDSVPAAIWAALHAPSNLAPSAPLQGISFPFPRNLIQIRFADNATQASRQAAVDLIHGQVVGGLPISEAGDYFVTIQDDGTSGPLFVAIAQLKALPQVALASPNYIIPIGPNYLRPFDGTAWRAWSLNPDSSQGDNWSLEAIAAPMAWGCSTGDPSVTIGIIDNGFDSLADLASNVSPNSHPNYGLNTSQHGTKVSSVLGARGNNSSGMTGVMWRATLNLQQYSYPNTDPIQYIRYRIRSLATSGVPIINISSGINWQGPAGQGAVGHLPRPTPVDSARVDSALSNRLHADLQTEIASLAASGYTPLIVFSGGNDGIDAWWSGVARLSADFPQQVIAVAGSDSLKRLMFRSNNGSLLQVAAPGYRVSMLDSLGNSVRDSGTSFAAPIVSGIAGLLKSFDPNLNTAQIRQLIIDGAVQGGRFASGFPIVNAYESLKLAAERPGAPLCGNRVWTENGGTIRVRRNATLTESVFSVGSAPWALTPMHGGKRLSYTTAPGQSSLLYNSATRTWQPGAPPFADTTPAGASNSIAARSHDGDRTAILSLPAPIPPNSSGQLGVSLRDTAGVTTALASITIQTPPPGSGSLCRLLSAGGNCVEGYIWQGMQEYQTYHVAFPPRGNKILVSVTRLMYSIYPDSVWYPCNVQSGDSVAVSCRAAIWDFLATRTNVYSVDTLTHTVVSVDSIIGQAIYWLGMSENDSTTVVGIGGRSQSFRHDPVTGYSPTVYASPGCAVEYLPRLFGSPAIQHIPTSDACHFINYNTDDHPGGGTIAASSRTSSVVDSPPRPNPTVRPLFP